MNKKRLVASIILCTTTIIFLSAYLSCKASIRKYQIPFMKLRTDFSRTGKYEAVLNKTFNPSLAIALCIVPEKPQYLPPVIFQGLDVVIDITNDRFNYSSNCSFTRGHKTMSGSEYYCMYLPPEKFAPGQYRCVLTVIKSAEQWKDIPLTIIAYPIYDFLPMIADFFLIFFTISFLASVAIVISWKVKDTK